MGLQSLNASASLGFETKNDNEAKQAQSDFEKTEEKVLSDLRAAFRPEFLNRVDNIITFRPLDLKSLSKIAELQIEELCERLKKQNIHVKADKKALALIAKKSFAPDQGARAIRRSIENLIEAPLADGLLSGQFKENERLTAKVEKNNIALTKA